MGAVVLRTSDVRTGVRESTGALTSLGDDCIADDDEEEDDNEEDEDDDEDERADIEIEEAGAKRRSAGDEVRE